MQLSLANPLKLLDSASKGNYQTGGQEQIYTIITNIITVALSFVGVILLVYIIYAGYLWMTAGGNEEKTRDAKTIIKNCVIGLIIIILSYAISQFVVGSLAAASIAAPAGGAKPNPF